MDRTHILRALQVDERDNVAVAVQDIAPGDRVQVGADTVTAREPIPVGHKLALRDIPAGAMVVKYGVSIGRATAVIGRGCHAHTQNMEDITEQLCREYAAAFRAKAGEER